MSLADLLADTARCALETGDLEPLRNALRAYDAAEANGACKCGKLGDPEHACPYASDVGGDDSTLCNCCSECQQNCCDDI